MTPDAHFQLASSTCRTSKLQIPSSGRASWSSCHSPGTLILRLPSHVHHKCRHRILHTIVKQRQLFLACFSCIAEHIRVFAHALLCYNGRRMAGHLNEISFVLDSACSHICGRFHKRDTKDTDVNALASALLHSTRKSHEPLNKI